MSSQTAPSASYDDGLVVRSCSSPLWHINLKMSCGEVSVVFQHHWRRQKKGKQVKWKCDEIRCTKSSRAGGKIKTNSNHISHRAVQNSWQEVYWISPPSRPLSDDPVTTKWKTKSRASQSSTTFSSADNSSIFHIFFLSSSSPRIWINAKLGRNDTFVSGAEVNWNEAETKSRGEFLP